MECDYAPFEGSREELARNRGSRESYGLAQMGVVDVGAGEDGVGDLAVGGVGED